MLKPTTFLKATTISLTACILAACGGDSSNSAEQSSQTLSTDTHSFTVSSMDAKEGKSVFNLNLKDDSGTAIASVTPNMTPMMAMDEAMGGHNHSTPSTGCTATDTDGNSQCTVYFLMPSVSASGNTMGKWSLNFSVPDSEGSVSYSPNVVANSKAKAQLKGGMNDQISSMAMSTMAMTMDSMSSTEARTYYIFNNDITQTGDTSSVEVFLAAKESMMSFPTLEDGATLSEGTDHELTIDDMSVELKISGDNIDWVTATSQGNGIWAATDISDISNTLYLALTVNGEMKTTDGGTPVEIEGVSTSVAQIILSTDTVE
jgi:hypothetical protein